MICPDCGNEFKEGTIFCPKCGTTGEFVDESKKNKKSTLIEEIFDYLNQEFEEVYAVGYNNVKGIDIFDERNANTTADERFTRWIKESTSLVLKDGKAFLSVEMMPTVNTTPITIAGNILVHFIGDSAIVKFNGRRNDVEFILSNKQFPRYLLIVIPDPDEGVDSNKDEQMKIIEQLIKELKILDNSSIKNFKICLANEFEETIKDIFK